MATLRGCIRPVRSPAPAALRARACTAPSARRRSGHVERGR